MKIFETLESSNFKRLWFSQVFSQIPLNIIAFALILHIYSITNSTTSISLVMIASAAPVALFGPFAGVIADRIDYRKILIVTNVLRVLTTVLLLFAKSNVLAMLEIIFLLSAISMFFSPAEQSSIPIIVRKEKLLSANSLVMTTTYVTMLVGYAIAGPLLNFIGTTWLFVICALLYAIATEATRRMSSYDKKEIKKLSLEHLARGVTEVWNEAREGIRYLRNSKEVLDPMIKLTVGWTILGMFITLLPAYGKEVLNIDPKLVGPLIIVPAGVGMVVAASFLSRRKRINGIRTINKGFYVVAASLLIFSFYRFYEHFFLSLLILLGVVVVMGFGSGIIQVGAQTLLHVNSDEDKRGRVFGFSSMQLRLATLLPAVLIGALTDMTSAFVAMLSVALLVAFFVIYLLFQKPLLIKAQ